MSDSKCKASPSGSHEWRAGLVWGGCMPGAYRQDFRCVRCGARERRPFDRESFIKGCHDMIEVCDLEIAMTKTR